MFDGLTGRRQRELGIPAMVLPSGALVPEVACQVETLELGGDSGRKRAGVEQADRADAALAVAERLPGRSPRPSPRASPFPDP